MKSRFGGLSLAFLIALGALTGSAVAETYPSRAVNIIVPFPAGGRTDLTARLVAQYLAKHLGVPAVVVNKPGAGGVLGAEEVAQARPDGYTLGFFSTGALTAQYTVPTPLDLKKYDLIAIVNVDPAAVAVGAQSPWKTLHDLAEYGAKNPGKIRVGAQMGASAQVFAAAFAKAAGISVTYVPFKGDADAAMAVAGGHVDMHVGVPVAYKALVAAGKVRILGVAADKRSSLYGDIPTWREQGVPMSISSFHGVFIPKGAPPQVLNVLARAIEQTMQESELRKRMDEAGLGVVYLDRKDAIVYVAQQDDTYRALIKELGLMVSPKQ